MAYRRVSDPSEVVVFFKTQLRDGADRASYEALDEKMYGIVSGMPGFLSIKQYVAGDGERVSIVRFRSQEALDAWREDPDHRETQRRGRDEFYERYWVQACKVLREYEFVLDDG